MGLLLDLLPFILIGLVVLVPTRRLFLAGWPSSFLLTYYLIVVGLGAIIAELRAPARYLVPILVVLYVAPFVTAGAGLARLMGRRGANARPVRPVVHHVYPIAIPRSVRPEPGDEASATSEPDVDQDDAERAAGQRAGPDEEPANDEDPPIDGATDTSSRPRGTRV